VVEAIDFGHECCRKITAGNSPATGPGRKPKRAIHPPPVNEELLAAIDKEFRAELSDALNTGKYLSWKPSPRRGPQETRRREVSAARTTLKSRRPSSCSKCSRRRIFRDEMLKNRRRPDGRAFDEVRNIDIEVGLLPRTHGSALFTRGEPRRWLR